MKALFKNSLPLRRTLHAVTLIALTLSLPAAAQDDGTTLENLSWLDRQYLEKQTEKIDDIARLQLGMQLHGNHDDLEILQRIIYKGLIAKDDVSGLQAMGAVLGNIMVEEIGLEWKVYEDRVGRSRATCVPNSSDCLFPITMLSRRMEVGLLPDVNKVYSEAKDMITPRLPKNPYFTE